MFAGSRLLLPDLRTLLHWCRNPGGRRDMLSEEALAAEGDRGAEEVGQHGEAETASGCPRRWCWNDRRSGGTEGSLPCSWVQGGVAAVREGAEESAPFARRPEPAAIRHCLGRSRERGLAAGCPRLEEPSPSARRRRSVRPSTKDVQYHRMAPRVRASQLVEDRAAACPGTGPRIFFFFFSSLPSLVSVSPHPSVSFSLASSVLTPRYATAAVIVERSLGSTPRPARGDGGMWRVGRGREPWERSEAGGVNDNDRHLHHSPVSSPTEELRKDKRRSVDSGRRERTRPGF